MHQRLAFVTLLLLTSQLVAPAVLAQSAGGTASPSQASPPPAATSTTDTSPNTDTPQAEVAVQDQEQVDVSTPGADDASEDIVVVGRNIPNVVRATSQVITVLSAADIARTGEGDIAGALTRVTGLSVVGGGFVYVRGLGDRYSSSLLNGSPLPSPEPLRRSVPLDIFPTTIVGSALVQKTYSANYPGEFGGGVINLTTKAIPAKPFLSAGLSVSADTVTTSELGYTYDGGDWDWTGYDDGTRDVPRFIRDAPAGTGIIPVDQVARLTNARTTLLQRNDQLPANFSGEISGGSVIDIGSDRLGVISSISLSNTWRTRVTRQQDTVSVDGTPRNDFNTLITDNRAVANALIGLGYEFGDNTIRLTNVYIHDTLKQARGSVSTAYINAEQITDPATGLLINAPRFQQNTNWFERALFESQLVGEFKLTDAFSLDVRGAYANSKRKSPYERQFDYLCQQQFQTGAGGPPAQATVTDQNGAGGVQCPGAYAVTQRFPPTIAFSDLNEDLYSGQADLSYKLPTDRPFTVSAGYYYFKNDRTSSRLDFRYQLTTGSGVPGFPYNLYRPDYLLSPDVLNNATPLQGAASSQVNLLFSTVAGAYAYDAKLEVHAGYLQAEAEASDGLRATIGLRYEDGREDVTPVNSARTRLSNDYLLPAATITWNFAADMQLRAAASKTLSRPQFRELAPQQFRDPDSDRLFFGNLNLRDSELYNLEARYEWFFARDQRVTLAGFYKRIDNPIEQVGFYTGSDDRLQTGFTNLPEASLYGGEFEVQKYVPLYSLGGPFATRRLVAIANYTYTKSEIAADDRCVPNPAEDPRSTAPGIGGCPSQFGPASALFRDGAPLTGQSDHLVNLQLGIEDTEALSQVTLLFNYASDRVTNRGPSNLGGSGLQPDIVEKPGIRLDLVARQGFDLLGGRVEVKAEARNLTGTGYLERQTFDGGNTIFINRYRQGRIFSLGASVAF